MSRRLSTPWSWMGLTVPDWGVVLMAVQGPYLGFDSFGLGVVLAGVVGMTLGFLKRRHPRGIVMHLAWRGGLLRLEGRPGPWRALSA